MKTELKLIRQSGICHTCQACYKGPPISCLQQTRGGAGRKVPGKIFPSEARLETSHIEFRWAMGEGATKVDVGRG